jgi:hypothetical protein
MTHLTHVPRPPLSGLVESFWLYDGYAPPHAMERVLPSGTIEIVINLRGRPTSVSGVSTSTTSPSPSGVKFFQDRRSPFH